MKLVEIEKFKQVIESKDTEFIDERDNSPVDKTEIGHYVIVYDSKPELWEKEVGNLADTTKKKRATRKKKVVVEKEEEDDNKPIDEDEIMVSEDQLVRTIAKQLRITEASSVILKNNGWFVVPIFKSLSELRPIEVKKNSKNYTLVIKDVPLVDFGTNILEGCRPNDYRYNSLEVLHSALREYGIDHIIPKAIFRARRNNQDLVELRTMVNQSELLQRTRIKVGNNIISLIYTNLGRNKFLESKEAVLSDQMGKQITEEESMDNLDKIKVLDVVLKDYDKIKQFTNQHNAIVKDNKTFRGLETTYISSYLTFCMVEEYVSLLNIETKINNVIKALVREQPIWQNYLVGIKGIAENSAAYLIAYFDIYKAVHPSAFLRYVGLDQIPVTPDKDQVIDSKKLFDVLRLLMKDYELINSRVEYEGDKINEYNFDKYKTDSIESYAEYLFIELLYNQFNKDIQYYAKNSDMLDEVVDDIMGIANKNKVAKEMINRIANKFEIQIIDSSFYGKDTPMIKKRARKMTDKEIVPYLSKDGQIKLKQSLGYNNALKTKLLGVISASFLRARGGEYERIYREYRARLEARADNPKHVHRKAVRFQMQIFLEDYWMAVRTLEGLPLNGGTYREEKLKLFHKNRGGEIRQRPQLQATPQKIKTNKNVVKY